MRIRTSLLLPLFGAAVVQADVTTSKLQIQIPHSLFKDGGYDHRDALFGRPAYGGSIAQHVYYAQSTLCDANVDTSTGVPAREMENGKMKPWPAPYILMVDRGECSFVQKVRNAQRSGAAGVLIADNLCLCSDADCIAHSGESSCETQEPIMADDGSGGDISVPSFLMLKHDAALVKAELEANRPVQAEMAWALPKPDDRVEYELWSTPSDVVSKSFLDNFQVIAEKLGSRAYFTPHMYIYDGVRAGCQGSGDGSCYNLCTNGGRYCATDPDNDLEHGISGADVVKESLRRLCIWHQYGDTDGIGSQWWRYVSLFHDRCDKKPEFFTDEKCIKDVYKNAKVDGAAIERCMSDSGGTDGDQVNSKLDQEIATQEQRGVLVIPTALVNLVSIRGGLSVTNVFTAICSGYLEGTTPEACSQCSGCADPVTCVQKGRCPSGSGGGSGGVSKSFFAFSMFTVIGTFLGLGAWHYKKTRDDMRDQVRGILAEYMPLEDKDGEGGSSMMSGSAMDFAQGGAMTSLIS